MKNKGNLLKPIVISDSHNKGELSLGIGKDISELLDEGNLFEVLLIADQYLKELVFCLKTAVPRLELVVQGYKAACEQVLF